MLLKSNKPGIQFRWTDADCRYLITHKSDGAELVAKALGRSVSAVKMKASRLGVSLRPQPGELCPSCGCYRIRAGTSAAQHGLCPACWEREKARAMQERAATMAATAEYNAAKVRVDNARRKLARLHATAKELKDGEDLPELREGDRGQEVRALQPDAEETGPSQAI